MANWDQHIIFIAGKGRLEEAEWSGVQIGLHILHCESEGLPHPVACRDKDLCLSDSFPPVVGAESRIQMFCVKADSKKGRPHGNRNL